MPPQYFITTKNQLKSLTVEELWLIRENARALDKAISAEIADRFEQVTGKTLAKV